MTTDRQGIHHRAGGFTLAEATLAMVLLGMAAGGVLLPFVGGATAQAEGMRRTLAAKLAGDLMQQIAGTPYEQIIKDAGEPWNGWDGYTEAQGQVKDASGAVFADPIYAGFSREVHCNYVYVPQQDDEDPPCFFIFASVWVKYDGAEIAVLHRVISQ